MLSSLRIGICVEPLDEDAQEEIELASLKKLFATTTKAGRFGIPSVACRTEHPQPLDGRSRSFVDDSDVELDFAALVETELSAHLDTARVLVPPAFAAAFTSPSSALQDVELRARQGWLV